MNKRDIKSMYPRELEEYFKSISERPFRAEQVFKWLHCEAAAFDDMSNLSIVLRNRLDAEFYIMPPEIAGKLVSEIDGTIKYLWRYSDGNAVESVVMQYTHGNTVCVSTQAGCRMGCVFCASTLEGLERNLTASEIEDQVIHSQKDSGKRISGVVLMGTGEPLDNYENVLRFIRNVNHPSGLNIGARHITLSTCGIVPNIDKLAGTDIQLTLSVSLHAPDDETRNRLMPVNRVAGVEAVFDACARYFKTTGRRVTYEYAMIDGINDTPHHAGLLAKRLKNKGSHVNLILLNSIPERNLNASSAGSVLAFTGILDREGINFTIRRRLGADINAACGQLRREQR